MGAVVLWAQDGQRMRGAGPGDLLEQFLLRRLVEADCRYDYLLR